MTHHELLIIGTGSGNSILTPDFDGVDVAIVERDVFGGTCLNRGCIPSKMFVYAAEIAELARVTGPRLGVHTSFDGADWPAIRDRVFDRIDPIAAGGERYRTEEQDNVTVYRGSAAFTGPRSLDVAMNDGGTESLTADTIVLAAGARAVVLDVIAESGVRYHTSDDVMRLDALPDRLIVVGGGYIGAELGNVFGMLGSHVTIINRSEVLLSQEDPEISRRFTDAYAEKFDLITGATITAATEDAAGIHLDVLTDAAHRGSPATFCSSLRAELQTLINCMSKPQILRSMLNGYVITDEFLRTTSPEVWALGDITNPAQLKHTANAEAKVVAHNIAHPDDLRTIDRRATPHAIFGHPQVAAVGLTEPQAAEAGRNVVVSTRMFGDTAYGWAMEDTTSVCKLIADADTRLLLGAHIIGPQASTLIQQLIQGMMFGQTVDEMARGQLYIHPALTEVVEQALLDL